MTRIVYRQRDDHPEQPGLLHKNRRRFESAMLACIARGSICHCQTRTRLREGVLKTSLNPNRSSCLLLKKLLREDDIKRNPYLTWSREELRTSLLERGTTLPEQDSRFAYRTALEEADKQRCFRLMDLPREIRLMIYKEAFSTDKGANYTLEAPSRISPRPPLLSISREICQEAIGTFYRTTCFILKGSTLSVKDSLANIEPSVIVNLRQIIFRRPSSAYSVRINLSCLDAASWAVTVENDHLPNCHRSHWSSLGHILQGSQEKLRLALERRLQVRSRRLDVKMRGRNVQIAQDAIDRFVALCGQGNGVRPTTEGLKILLIATQKMIRY